MRGVHWPVNASATHIGVVAGTAEGLGLPEAREREGNRSGETQDR